MNELNRRPVAARISTGIADFDTILGGGLTPERVYLLEGTPGSGKTTIALQFLLDGAARRSVCISPYQKPPPSSLKWREAIIGRLTGSNCSR
jgi:KaiC/GvpD/RAD55 family RecA-like ATPase